MVLGIAVAMMLVGCSSAGTTPSATVTTLQPDAEQWFRVSVESVPERDGTRVRLQGYVTNLYGEAAGRVQLLAQALDNAGNVVDQKITWLPYPVPAFDRVYYDIPNMPQADRYRVTIWYYERRKFGYLSRSTVTRRSWPG
jgi:hypothetical protein